MGEEGLADADGADDRDVGVRLEEAERDELVPVDLHGRRASNEQMELALRMIRKPIEDAARYDRVWTDMLLPLRDAYEMNP